MTTCTARLDLVEELVRKGKDVSKGKSLAEAAIDWKWIHFHGVIARRCRDFGLTKYSYGQGPSVSTFGGGILERREWPLRKAMENHNGMRLVFEYEANYKNETGYCIAFSEAAMEPRNDSIAEEEGDKALLYAVWSHLAVQYGLRVSSLRCEVILMVARDPTYAKLVMPSLEQRNDLSAAEDLVEQMEKLEAHMSSQLMKAVANLSARNATGRAGKGGAARS